jgi:AraC family transcriptional regulator, transcriptional activator of pobA
MAIIETKISNLKTYEGNGFIENDLHIFDSVKDLPIPNNPCRLSYYIIGVCLHGKAQYSVDTEDLTIKENDAIVIHERQVLDNYMFSSDFDGIFLFISNNFFNEVIKGIHDLVTLFLFTRSHPVISLTAQQASQLTEYYNILKRKVNEKDNFFRKDFVRSLLLAAIYDMSNIIYRMQQTNKKSQTRAESIFANFLHLVEGNYKKERRVNWYANQLTITSKYLSETVKQVSKRTPNEWIDRFVMLEIKVLLKNSMMNIKEIAQDLNFPNQSFLGKYFKEHTGLSPSEYRKS